MITIYFFAGMKEAAGTPQMTWEIEETTVKNIREKVKETYPQLHQAEFAMTAVNEEFAGNDETVRTGDTVAFIPPVSGG
ncbi:molybdopterin converting factor subunit 1 [Alkalicoccus saliphilus]|jgi:sulfur-carrier protein|uniref:Molybdopterin synthase sulfur carrier subunit n=1 Tax=Alkalicoccus saliphilus TaxID=200989 RepID=A0A2T4U3R7_9BACI|nr:molybdopterin converting factor subunit 1 [Alkalicoccus saliphilus]PTL38047.1 molybdopterin converting factor subunit 1 [Alkalicoccus saliphilus]